MKVNKDTKIAVSLVAAFILMVALYAADGIYSRYTGKLETEYILTHSEVHSMKVDGFAVRDENISVNGKNTSIFYKDDALVYVPVISDSENIGKNGLIALGFSDENQASSYLEAKDLQEKIDKLKENANKQGLNHGNVLFLNSQISIGVSNYIKALQSNNISGFETVVDSVAGNITSKQNAIGEDIDYNELISDYSKQIKTLKASYKIQNRITSPYAGYFVSNVDGYESSVNYSDVSRKNINNGDGTKYASLSPQTSENAFGKLITQHTWYYIFDVKASDAAVLKSGYWVNVAFNDLGISDLDMLVYDITEEKDGIVTVTLKCTAMNEKIASIRKDSANITVKKYKGFKISNEAVTENDEGVMGVYTIVGNIIKFSPINILYYTDDYVIAEGVRMLRDEEDESSGYYHKLKQYDKIIVKGRNLEDGNIVS